MKFGGTSVASPAGWRRMAELVRAQAESGHRVALVCSAIGGVTEALQQWLLASGSSDRRALWARIRQYHHDISGEFKIDPADLLEEVAARLEVVPLRSEDPVQHAGVLAEGEFLSTRLGCRILRHWDWNSTGPMPGTGY